MEVFIAILAYVYFAPIAARVAMLDAKLDPEPGEDETRALVLKNSKPSKLMSIGRLNRSFCRRWMRAANYQLKNIERAIEGKPVDNCPRLTRAKRDLWKTLNEDHKAASARKKIWRDDPANHEKELQRQAAERRIAAETKYAATITIDGVDCERAIIAVDGEGMDATPETVIETVSNGKIVEWPDHYTVLLGAGGVGFVNTEGGPNVRANLPMVWRGR